MSCPDISALQTYVERTSDDDSRNAVRAHLEHCAECRELLLALAPALDSTAGARRLDTDTLALSSRDQAVVVTVGATIGRYIVISRIGEGGMGVVYAAYDPNLDRKVALKLIRRGRADLDEAGLEALQERLLREAHAMARVAHPNVATIHDVGRAGEHVFVAMELITGETLAQWLTGAKRSPEQILETFIHAGRGLMAAHSAGLVHRDFKPSNVMIGSDGRVRVLDFGLARPAGVAGDGSRSPSPPRIDQVLTATGTLVGTPAYMAPEQRTGAATDARSDQFSFCVALYEALYGQHPFAGTTTTELAARVREGRVSPPPPDARVSPRLRAVLLRGLSPSSADRFPEMDALLAELGRDPRPRLRRFAPAIAGVLVVVAAGVVWRTAQRSRLAICRGGAASLAGVWDDARRAQMHAGFIATGKPFAEPTFTAMRRRLDDFAAAWQSMYTDACEASVRDGQSELVDLRLSCLQEQRSRLQATTEIFSHVDGPMLEKAVQAADALGDVQRCGDVVALRAPLPPPPDPTARRRIGELRQELARVRALDEAGKYNDAMKPATDLVTEAAALGYAPLHAEALIELGTLQDRLALPESVKTLGRAAVAGEAGRDEEAVAHAWSALVRAHDLYTQDREAAHQSAAHAQVYIDRLGDKGLLAYTLAGNLAHEYGNEGNYEESQRQMEHALAIAEHAFGVESVRAASARGYLAYLMGQRGVELDRAEAFSAQAVSICEKVLGIAHPTVGNMLEIQGTVLLAEHKYAQASASYRRAIALLEPSLGKDHPHIAQLLGGLADALRSEGKLSEALAAAQRSLDIRQRTRAKNRDLGYAYFTLATLHFEMHQASLALDEIDRAIAVLEPALGRAHPYFAVVLSRKVEILLSLHRDDEAERILKEAVDAMRRDGVTGASLANMLVELTRRYLDTNRDASALATAQRALDLRESLHVAPPELLEALALLGEAQRRNADQRARPTLEQALALASQPDANPMMLSYVQFSLARALTAAERSRARALASEALALYVKDGNWPQYVAQIEAWLRRHPASA